MDYFSLIKGLKETSRAVSLNDEKKLYLKERLFNQILSNKIKDEESLFLEKLKNFTIFVRNEAKAVFISCHSKALLKEKIFFNLEKRTQGFSFQMLFSYFFRPKLISQFLLFLVLIGIAVPVFFNGETAYAKRENYLIIEEGKVTVLRQNKIITPLERVFVLEQGDDVETYSNSKAEIRFFDSDVTRLDENTSLELIRLPQDTVTNDTLRAIDLKEGRIWSKVFIIPSEGAKMLISSGSRFVASANTKSTFDFSIENNQISLRTLENAVNVHVIPKENTIIKKSILEGYRIELSYADATIDDLSLRIIKDEPSPKDQWTAENIQKDKMYQNKLKKDLSKELKEKSGLLSDNSPFNKVKIIAQSADLNMTFNPLEREEKLIELAIPRLSEIIAFILQEKQDENLFLESEFKQLVSDISNNINHVAEEKKAFLKEQIQTELLNLKRNLAHILPNSSLYFIKEQIRLLELSLHESLLKKLLIQIGHSSDRVLEIKDLIYSDYDENLVTSLLAQYLSHFDRGLSTISGFNSEDKLVALNALLESKILDLEIFKVIEKSPLTSSLDQRMNKVIAQQLESVELLMKEITNITANSELAQNEVPIKNSINVLAPVLNLSATPDVEYNYEDDLEEKIDGYQTEEEEEILIDKSDALEQIKALSVLKDDLSSDLATKVKHIESLVGDYNVVEIDLVPRNDATPDISLLRLKRDNPQNQSNGRKNTANNPKPHSDLGLGPTDLLQVMMEGGDIEDLFTEEPFAE